MDAETLLALRTACVEKNVATLNAEPFGDAVLDKLVDVREVLARAEAGEPIRDLL